jgi:hypothetical protein
VRQNNLQLRVQRQLADLHEPDDMIAAQQNMFAGDNMFNMLIHNRCKTHRVRAAAAAQVRTGSRARDRSLQFA